MGQRRRFTPEFKRQAVQLLNAGQRPAAEIARELGIPRNRPTNGKRKWRRAAGRSTPYRPSSHHSYLEIDTPALLRRAAGFHK